MNTEVPINLKNIRLLLFTIYCIICFHFTDIKLFDVKLNELVSLLLIPFLLFSIRSVNKYLLYFLFFFTFLLLFTFLFNLNREFYLNLDEISILKKPYVISIARFIEYIACLVFAIVVYKTIVYANRKGLATGAFLESVLNANVLIAFFFIGAYILTYYHFFSLNDSTLLYDRTPWDSAPDLRLRGFYVEGGPLGLLFCFLYILSLSVNSRKKKWFYQVIFLTIILLARSKAGMVGVAAWHTYTAYMLFRHTRWLKPFVFVLAAGAFYIFFINYLDGYIYEYNNFYKELPHRKTDYNFVMGRIAAVFITPNMVAENPLFGIGLGNYAIVRNDPDYLGLLPPVKGWDAPGLGVFITLLIESGLTGLLSFLLILYLIYRRYKRISGYSEKAVKVFFLICFLGVQLHFIYIWFLIGLAVAAPEEDLPAADAPVSPTGY